MFPYDSEYFTDMDRFTRFLNCGNVLVYFRIQDFLHEERQP